MRVRAPYRVVVCGGRHYRDRAFVFAVLDALQPDEVAEGGATGADAAARAWCRSRGVPYRTFRADWDGLGKRAGPVRNGRMLREFRPDAVVAFPGGRGTADCRRQALGLRIPVLEGEALRAVAGGIA